MALITRIYRYELPLAQQDAQFFSNSLIHKESENKGEGSEKKNSFIFEEMILKLSNLLCLSPLSSAQQVRDRNPNHHNTEVKWGYNPGSWQLFQNNTNNNNKSLTKGFSINDVKIHKSFGGKMSSQSGGIGKQGGNNTSDCGIAIDDSPARHVSLRSVRG